MVMTAVTVDGIIYRQRAELRASRALRKEWFWDLHSHLYDVAWDAPTTTAVVRQIVKSLPSPNTVVDLGCGTGLFSQTYRSNGSTVIGVDGSRRMLMRALERGRITEAKQADASNSGLPRGCADLVVCANLLHLHPYPEAVIDEAARLSAEGGALAFVTPNLPLRQSDVYASDIRSGRRWDHSAMAHLARAMVSVPAGFARIHPRSSAEVLAVLSRVAPQWGLVESPPRLFNSTQLLIIYRRHGDAAVRKTVNGNSDSNAYAGIYSVNKD